MIVNSVLLLQEPRRKLYAADRSRYRGAMADHELGDAAVRHGERPLFRPLTCISEGTMSCGGQILKDMSRLFPYFDRLFYPRKCVSLPQCRSQTLTSPEWYAYLMIL